jgi:hypothetical protein
MSRFSAFILVRLVAILWLLVCVKIAEPLGSYVISFIIVLSEAVLGYVWGKAEAVIVRCRPSSTDPRKLFVLTMMTGIVEAFGALFFIGVYVPMLVLWRVATAYVPFALVEAITYRNTCRARK